MQDVPALLASLHGLSAFDDQGDVARDTAEAHDRAEHARQQRERREQQELDRAAALRLQQHQQRREDDERRQAMQAEAAKARLEMLERARARDLQAERDYKAYVAQVNPAKRDHQQRPTTSRGPAAATTARAVTSAAPPGFKYKVHACIEATSAAIAQMISDSEAHTRRLQEDLATKLREEASYGDG
jgi:hypothetical protein